MDWYDLTSAAFALVAVVFGLRSAWHFGRASVWRDLQKPRCQRRQK
jgi:hypothetical protein